jgi:hypothetical protein
MANHIGGFLCIPSADAAAGGVFLESNEGSKPQWRFAAIPLLQRTDRRRRASENG